MRKHPSLILLAACLVLMIAYAAWVLRQGAGVGGWTGVIDAWPYLAAGGLTVAAVLGLFVWLAMHSDKSGYDARAGRNRRPPSTPR